MQSSHPLQISAAMITVPVAMIASKYDSIDHSTSITIPEAKRRYSMQNERCYRLQICKCGKENFFDSYSVKMFGNPTVEKPNFGMQ